MEHLEIDHDKERKLQILAALVTIGLGIAFVLNRSKSATPTTADTLGGTPAQGVTAGVDPVAAQLQATEDALKHSASFSFTSHLNSNGQDVGSHSSGSSGSGGFNLFGIFGIGGGGSKSGSDTWNLTSGATADSSLGGSNLDSSEFAMLVEQAQSLANIGAQAQISNQNSLLTREHLYKK